MHGWQSELTETLSLSLSVSFSVSLYISKGKVQCRADSLVPMHFAIFPSHLSKVLRLPRKSEAKSNEVLHLSCKSIVANLMIWCSKMQHLSGNLLPEIPNISVWWRCAPATKNNSWTSKSGPDVVCFSHFDLETCFAPQPRALSQHLNVQKRSGPEVLFEFSNLNASRQCSENGVFSILTSTCASRHSCMSAFHLSILSEVWRLSFLRSYQVGYTPYFLIISH